MQRILVILLSVALWSIPMTVPAGENDAQEMEEVVVTATRLQTPKDEVASSITVITEDQIKQSEAIMVHQVLRTVPGLDVVQNGGPGQPTSVFIRGAKSEHTLVLIDGVEANDPFNPGRTFDFSGLTVDNVARIEVLRGPQSTLYGSDAMAGVINIITRRGEGEPRVSLFAEGGSFSTLGAGAEVAAGTGWGDYSLAVSHRVTDGFSAASEADGNREDDGYRNTTLSGRTGIILGDDVDLDLVLRAWDSEADADDFDDLGNFGDDPNAVLETRAVTLRAQTTFLTGGGFWEGIVGLSYALTDKDYSNDPDPINPVLSPFSSEGRTLKADWQNNLRLSDSHILTLGLETERDWGEFQSQFDDGSFASSDMADESLSSTGVYLQDRLTVDRSLFATLGVRWDDYSQAGSEVTYRVAPAYRFGDSGLKVRGSYGTAFNAPTIYQLFSATYGNPDLKPESSVGWDVGLDQALAGGKGELGVTYFSNRFEDLIVFGFPYANEDEASSEGVELTLTAGFTDSLTGRISYTYTESEDASGDPLLRIPENKASLDLNYSFPGSANLFLEALYVGDRDDQFFDFNTFTTTRVELEDYTLVNLSGSVNLTEGLELFGRVENLLDEEYEEVLGYGTPGISGYLGIKATL